MTDKKPLEDHRKYKNVTAHRLIAHVAEELAQEIYEDFAKDNDWYKNNKDRANVVRMLAPELRDTARGILSHMLTRNDVSEHEKKEIYDALLMDKELPLGGTSIAERIN